MSLTTHVLDAVHGRPAEGLGVRWETRDGAAWLPVAVAGTDADGRVRTWDPDAPLVAGVHRLVFDTGAWFADRGRPTFYPEVVLVFAVTDPAAHHHVPLLLSPFAYSTYRGS